VKKTREEKLSMIPMASPFLVNICSYRSEIILDLVIRVTDFGAKCEKCETINMLTLEDGEFKKQE
jgi:hypothetical protein